MRIDEQGADFSLPDVTGETISLSSLAGKKAIAIIFSCNHCPYVKAYENRLINIQEEYEDKGLAIVAINSNDDRSHPEDSYEKMKEHAADKGFNFLYLRDETAETARAYEAKYTPEVFLLDEKRVLKYKGRIDDCWQSETGIKRHDLRKAIEDVLNNREVAVKSTTPIGCTIKWP